MTAEAWGEEFGLWTNELLLGRKRKKASSAPKGKSPWTGAGQRGKQVAEYPGKGSKADVRGRLTALAKKRSTQVLVKIPKGGRKTAKGLADSAEYLSRKYEEDLLDENGRKVAGKDAIGEMLEAWKYGGPTLDESSDRTEAFHIIFSMREGTDEKAVHGATRATAHLEFAGHQWVMVQHFDEPQVHVHVMVKAEGMDGRRLNPRKADLDRWRERFAYELRERGVEAEATRRAPRLQREKVRTPWAASQMQKRGEATNPAPAMPDPVKAEKWNRTESEASTTLEKILQALARSDDVVDRDLARDLERTVTKQVAQNRATDRTQDRPRAELERT